MPSRRFNFTSIGGNLPTAPAIMGNVAIWKPAPDFVVQLVVRLPGPRGSGPPARRDQLPAGQLGPDQRCFDREPAPGRGSTSPGPRPRSSFCWRQVAENLENYRSYPRDRRRDRRKGLHPRAPVRRRPGGECPSPSSAADSSIRARKCSAASRVYIPSGMWPEVKARVGEMLDEVKMGDPAGLRELPSAP